MAENKNEVIDINTRRSIDNVMDSRPSSLRQAIGMDIKALLPQSEIAIERRGRIRKAGKNTLIALGVAAPVALFGAIGADNLLPANEVGSTIVQQDQGEGLNAPLEEGLRIISEETGVNVTGADVREGVTDLTNEGVSSSGYAGLQIEVTASKSAVFGIPQIEAHEPTNSTTETTTQSVNETFPPALPLDTED